MLESAVPAFALTIRDEKQQIKDTIDGADPNSKQYIYIHDMVKQSWGNDEYIIGMSPHEYELFRTKFMNDYMEPLMVNLGGDLWKEIIIADPKSKSKFICNLMELFDFQGSNAFTNLVHFRIAVAAAVVFCEPQILQRNQSTNGAAKVPDPTMIESRDGHPVLRFDRNHRKAE